MGEAKRRKQLGLMPTVHPFEAELTSDGQVKVVRGPEDARLGEVIKAALEATQLFGAAWDSEFRAAQALSGKYSGPLVTLADVQAIPVAPLRHLTGELALGNTHLDTDDVLIPVEGGHVRLRGQKHSFDGARWEEITPPSDPNFFMRVLQGSPAFQLEGELIGQFRAEHWQEGRIDIEPDPPEELLEFMESVVREWHGDTPELWDELHSDLTGQDYGPMARRTVFEVRKPAPLQSPLSRVFAVRGEVEFFPLAQAAAYTLDGEQWLGYDGEIDEETGLPAELAELFDMELVGTTVYADGRVDWEEGGVPGEHAERVRTDLIATTGAGHPAAWAAWTQELLEETFGVDLSAPGGQSLPVVQAVRLDLAADAIEDPDPLAQTFMESEVTFDGVNWRDLFDDDLPPEIVPFARPKPPTFDVDELDEL